MSGPRLEISWRGKNVRVNRLDGLVLKGKLPLRPQAPEKLGPAWAVLESAKLVEGNCLNLDGLLDFLGADKTNIKLMKKNLGLRKMDNSPQPTQEITAVDPLDEDEKEKRVIVLNSQILPIIGHIAADEFFVSKYGGAHPLFLAALETLKSGQINEFNQHQQSFVEGTLQGWTLGRGAGERFDMSGLNLNQISLNEARIAWANFDKALLSSASLKGATLNTTSLNYAILIGTEFEGARLEEVDLAGANLMGAIFRGAVIKEVSLKGASLGGTDFRDATLEGITYLVNGSTHKSYDTLEIKHFLEQAGAIV
ncbi:MAG: pentapeptide repeat-containing protein [Candidatus Margulisiibacteriota bacterium]